MSYIKLVLKEIILQLRGCQRIFRPRPQVTNINFYIYNYDHYHFNF